MQAAAAIAAATLITLAPATAIAPPDVPSVAVQDALVRSRVEARAVDEAWRSQQPGYASWPAAAATPARPAARPAQAVAGGDGKLAVALRAVAPPEMTPDWRAVQEEVARPAREDAEVDASIRRADEAMLKSRARLKELQKRYDREDGSTALQVQLATAATGILAAAAYGVVGIKEYGKAVAPGANARAIDVVTMQAEGLSAALRYAKQQSSDAASAAGSSLDSAYREATGRPPPAPSAASGEAAAKAVAAAATVLGPGGGDDDATKERALRLLLSGAGGGGGGKGPPVLALGVLILVGVASVRATAALPSALLLLPTPLSAALASGAASAATAWAAAKPALAAALAALATATKTVVAWGTTSMACVRAVLPHPLAS